jgi:hypothetical protein
MGCMPNDRGHTQNNVQGRVEPLCRSKTLVVP